MTLKDKRFESMQLSKEAESKDTHGKGPQSRFRRRRNDGTRVLTVREEARAGLTAVWLSL